MKNIKFILILLCVFFLTASYQTLSPVRRTFVFLSSRGTQPLTPGNTHALFYEFSKWRTGQKGKIEKTKRFCNEYSTYTPVRKANPRKKDTKLYDIEIDMILNRYRGPVSNLLRSAFNCLPLRLLAFLTAFWRQNIFFLNTSDMRLLIITPRIPDCSNTLFTIVERTDSWFSVFVFALL